MRLLYVTSSFPFGHGEGFLVAELDEIAAQGHDTVVLPTLGRGPIVHDDARRLMSRTRSVPLVSAAIASSALREIRARPAATARSLRRLRLGRSALILAKNAAVFPKALWTAQLARELAVDHIHAHWAGTSSTMAMVASELSGIPWSLTVHRWDIRENNLLASKASSASFVRAISADGLADLQRAVGEIQRASVIHMGVPVPSDWRAPGTRPTGEPFRVLVPANLIEVKGHRHLVDAIAVLESRGVSVRVTLAGQGPLRAQIESQIAAHGLERVVMLVGQLSHLELLGRLATGEWDAVAMPSVETRSGEKEGIPVSLLEAMSYGVPVVGTRSGGIVELLGDGSGLLVPPGDPGALAAAIESLAADGELRARVGARGRARVESDFAADSVVRDLVRAFEQASGVRAR